jgi:hypothetical protein
MCTWKNAHITASAVNALNQNFGIKIDIDLILT